LMPSASKPRVTLRQYGHPPYENTTTSADSNVESSSEAILMRVSARVEKCRKKVPQARTSHGAAKQWRNDP
jgi:K+-transporting ATPase c subunit